MNIRTYPNQRVSVLHKAKSDKNDPYTVINIRCMDNAMRELTGNEFKIYMTLLSDQDGYKQAISPETISSRMGGDKREVQKQINRLIEKGYLVQDKSQSNLFHIYECKDHCGANYHDQQEYMVESSIRTCGKTTGDPVGKHRDTTGENNVEIIEEIKDSTFNNTEASPIERANDSLVSQELKDKVMALYKEGKKYNKNNPEIQRETGLSGREIFDIINDHQKQETEQKKRQQEESWKYVQMVPPMSEEEYRKTFYDRNRGDKKKNPRQEEWF